MPDEPKYEVWGVDDPENCMMGDERFREDCTDIEEARTVVKSWQSSGRGAWIVAKATGKVVDWKE